MVRTLVADGVTVLLTTQYLDEADQLAHDIVVIDHGKVIATGTPDELKDKSGGQVLEVEPADRNMLEVAAAVLANRTGAVPDTNADSGLVRVPVADAAVLPAIIRELDEARVELAEFTLRKASLDEVFLALTGREPADPENYDDNGKTRELERSPR
jgi:oleandomycin transport system ATP-binding protein